MTRSTRATDDGSESTTVTRRAADWLSTRLAAGPLGPTAGGGLALVLVSAAVSLAGVSLLEETMRIRWSVGTHYGPEYAPTVVALAAFPVLVAVAVGAFRGVAAVLEGNDEFDATRPYYEVAALTVLLSLVFTQVALVAANLW